MLTTIKSIVQKNEKRSQSLFAIGYLKFVGVIWLQ